MHWSDVFAKGSRVGSLIAGHCDPHSGQPELKAEPVSVRPAGIEWHGLVIERPDLADCARDMAAEYRVRSQLEECRVSFLGFASGRDDWLAWTTAFMRDLEQLLTFEDGGSEFVVTGITDERLQRLIVVGRRPRNRDFGWLADIFAEAPLSAASKQALVRGLPSRIESPATCGESLCACHGTRRGAVADAVETRGFLTPEAVGAVLDAGTSCGSCLPEIRQMLRRR
jgi:assimilatory nitrate reductase catalytic subunit